MNAVLRIENLAPELDFPGFWNLKNLHFLKAILDTCKNKRIKKQDLPKISATIKQMINDLVDVPEGQALKQEYQFNRAEKVLCNEVIEHLQNNGWVCSFFQIKTKPFRPSLLPMNPKELSLLGVANDFRKKFWAGEIEILNNIPKIALLETVASTGVSINNLINSITSDKIQSLSEGWLEITISIEPSISTKLPVSAKAQLLFNWCLQNGVTTKAFHQALDYSLVSTSNSTVETQGFTLKQLLTALLNQPFYDGLEAILCSQLHSSQLPVSRFYPYSYLKEGKANKANIAYRCENLNYLDEAEMAFELAWYCFYNPDQLSNKELSKLTKPPHAISYSPLQELEFPETDTDSALPWSQECLITLRQLRFQLRKPLIDAKGGYRNGKLDEQYVVEVTENVFDVTINRAYERALASASKVEANAIEEAIDHIKNAYTGLHLAIDRIHHHLIVRQNTLDTCLAEMSSLFQYGILRYPGSSDLKNWDEEDFEILIHDYLLDREAKNSLKESTRQEILTNFRRLIEYSKKSLSLFPSIQLATGTQSFALRTRRNQVFGPREFDLLELEGNPTALLAFYAGLRSGEIANLTLDDVVTSTFEVVIYIRKGKTPSAKRSIPLHLIAPPKVVDAIRSYTDQRRIDYDVYLRDARKRKEEVLLRKEVYLLSTTRDCRNNTAKTVVRDALVNLKEQAGPEADLHLLRHSFASHLFLRWYTCRYPDFSKQLADQSHWFFKKEGIENLRIFFGEASKEPIPEANITAFTHIIKLFGHKTTNTLFQVYIHSFYEVIQHALKRVHKKDDDEILLGKLITELVPNMRSRKSQLKLKSRKAKDLVKLINL